MSDQPTVRPPLHEGDLVAVRGGYGGKLYHAGRLGPAKRTEAYRGGEVTTHDVTPLCRDYRTKDGTPLAKELPILGQVNVFHGELTEATRRYHFMGQPFAEIVGIKEARKCKYCVKVYENGGNGQPDGTNAVAASGLTEEELRKIANGEASPTGQPLKPNEARAVKALIDNDFATVRADLDQQYATFLRTETDRINAEFADTDQKIASAMELADAFRSRVKAEWAEVIGQIKSTGVSPSAQYDEYRELSITMPSKWTLGGKDRALKEMRTNAEAVHRQAVRTLEARRLRINRRILLAQVPAGLEALLEALPSASQVFAEAITEVDHERTAIEA